MVLWCVREPEDEDRCTGTDDYMNSQGCAKLHFAWFAGESPQAEIAEVRRRFRLDQAGDNE